MTLNSALQLQNLCGNVQEARKFFDSMPLQDSVSWTIMVSAYAQGGHIEQAKNLFESLPWKSLACENAMLQAYSLNGDLENAKLVFDRMTKRDVVSWTTMIGAYAQNGYAFDAKSLFDRFERKNIISWTAMVHAYSQNKSFDLAREMFERMPQHDVFSWNILLSAYAHNGHLESAKIAFERMPSRDVVAWNSIIAFFSQKGKLEEAKELFHLMPEPNTAAWNVMIQANAQAWHLDVAKGLFDQMPSRDVISWTTLMNSYADMSNLDGCQESAMDVFRLMDLHGVSPDSVTYIAIFDACSRIANAEEGSAFIASIVHPGILQDSVVVGNAALTMYGRSGLAAGAWSVFQQMPVRDSVSWNAMLTAFARNGHGEAALDVFLAMELEGLVPDIITFVNVLSACSHAGLLHRARGYFHSISRDYGLTPIYDHYVCLTDLLARSGRLVEAEELVNSMPFEPNYEAWMALLGACRSHGDVRRGNRAAGFFVQADVDAESPYILLSHLYAEAGSKDDVLVIRKAMRRKTKLDQSPVILGGLDR
ncbi:hypothetical protein SELMODRAFT_79356 [Selaginella moellendorffii]|uniref:Pentacotripeptide-repeat region of PRORP domain-containing protein n=1 Tax=Selaginella moellendorffii TaxID=88036 RepID=D8QWT8_SELML|nr:hypothetical protein SELMODRAFT_79356 [Selaginella moellendorffii]